MNMIWSKDAGASCGQKALLVIKSRFLEDNVFFFF